ncbi:hypothetical protein J6590_026526 [Homalodisca vitripennis]|nr:hypothetical protein J6590_026526 [Homalodisca vitripennis]
MILQFIILYLSACMVNRVTSRNPKYDKFPDDLFNYKTKKPVSKSTKDVWDDENVIICGEVGHNDLSRQGNEIIPGQANKNVLLKNSNTFPEDTQDNEVDQDSAEEKNEEVEYWFFPWMVYFFITVTTVIAFMVLIRLIQWMKESCPEMCPALALLPCDIGICHRSTVVDEDSKNLGNKGKVQLSLVNVNKHYYKLDGSDVP